MFGISPLGWVHTLGSPASHSSSLSLCLRAMAGLFRGQDLAPSTSFQC